MKFKDFLANISTIKDGQLGGLDTQLKMTPLERKQLDYFKIINKNPKESAVLMLFYPNNNDETCFLLTKRASYKGTHSAQISFPGGKVSNEDNSLEKTALRETFEEVNVKNEAITIIKKLTKTYIPPSNFWVYPFIGYIDSTPKFVKNYEVETLIEVKLLDLLDDKKTTSILMETSYMKKVKIPCFKFNDHIVWGATAMILNEVKELLMTLKP